MVSTDNMMFATARDLGGERPRTLSIIRRRNSGVPRRVVEALELSTALRLRGAVAVRTRCSARVTS